MLVLFATQGELARHLDEPCSSASLPMLLLAAAASTSRRIVVKGVRWWVFLRPVGATLTAARSCARPSPAPGSTTCSSRMAARRRASCSSRAARTSRARSVARHARARATVRARRLRRAAVAGGHLPQPAALAGVGEAVRDRAPRADRALLVWLLRRPDVVEAIAGPKPASVAWSPQASTAVTLRADDRRRSRAGRASSPRCCSASSRGRFRWRRTS